MKKKLKNFIDHAIPPGANITFAKSFIISGICTSVIYSMITFGHKYFEKYWMLFIRDGEKNVLSGKMMPNFGELFKGALIPLAAYMVASLLISIYYYSYYHQNSKSIYLMKRLPNRLERHIRALTLPILMCIFFFILAIMITLIYFGLYLLITPSECLLPDQWQSLWGYIL